ncbi:kinase subunit of RNA polymerase II carboxy-terminal domain kinase I [Myotisia sp. PD_48]|nr:kinase subunit of RNA polymerase II carboxy-terminal domain kinase I [Myotisia sp. PD_48]
MAGSPSHSPMRDQRRVSNKDEVFEHPRAGNEKGTYNHPSFVPQRRRDRERPARGRGGGSSGSQFHKQAPFRRKERKPGGNRVTSPSSHEFPGSQEQRGVNYYQPDPQVRPRQDEEPAEQLPHPPFPQRKRRRSISPSRARRHRPAGRGNGNTRDYSGRGGRFQDRRGSPNRLPLARDQEHRRANAAHFGEGPASESFTSRRGNSKHYPFPINESAPRAASPGFGEDREEFSRPPSRYTSRDESPTSPTHHTRALAGDSKPSESPQQIPNLDDANSNQATDEGDHIRDTYPTMHSVRGPEARPSRRPSHPSVDTRQQLAPSPQYTSPSDSRHASPQPGSPYSSGRAPWPAQQPSQPYHGQPRQMHGYSPPYRQSTYPPHSAPQGQYYQTQSGQYPSNPNQIPATYPSRGGKTGYRGGHYNQQQPDRRFSSSASQQYPNQSPAQRSRSSQFNSIQWNAHGGRGRGSHSGPHQHPPPQAFPPPPHVSNDRESPDPDEEDNPFRPSKDLQVEDQDPSAEPFEPVEKQAMPPPDREPSTTSQPKESGKFSFAFKSKTTQPPTPKPIPDLTQRMREPPRPIEMPKNRQPSVTSKMKHDTRFDRKDDRRDGRRGDRRFDHREDRRRDRRDERRPDTRPERRKERLPEREKPKKKMLTRMKPRPTLSEEFSRSDSVYYRKPGNESVVGAGTYGKVFKAVHVFTNNKVALKRIRMEGEKDGFPITAIREIRLLQHLRHENVVSLQEVMVEKNECFMVFEYLSHDLTGVINHPTFVLSAAHKKHLAKQMFEGLNYLHHRGVLHRDIKAANILISSNGQLKFADFGLARFFSKSRQLDYTNRVITIWYRPPELLLGETRYGPAADIWSAACVYMEMFTKKAIFPGDGSELNQMDKLYNSLGTPTRVDWPDVLDMPWFELMRPTERKKRVFEDLYRDCISPAALELVASIFQYDASKRPSAEDILNHPYFVSEGPEPQQAIEYANSLVLPQYLITTRACFLTNGFFPLLYRLADIEGDWHEFESKAHRKEKDKEARRAEYREKEKRKIGSTGVSTEDRENKRPKVEEKESAPTSQGLEN